MSSQAHHSLLMFDYPREDGGEEQDLDADKDELMKKMFATNIPRHQNHHQNKGEEEEDKEEDERKRMEEEKFAWALETSQGLSVGASVSNETKRKAATSSISSLSLKSSHQHHRVQPGVSKQQHHHHHHHTTTTNGAAVATGTSTKVDQVIKSILKSNNNDESNKPPPSSTPSINVREQAARTLRDRRSALQVVEMFMTLNKFDSESHLAASTASVLTQSEFKDACEERSLIGKCGWPLCSNEIKRVYKSKASQKLFSEETYCCAQHRIQSEVFAESNLKEKADDKKALPPRSDRHTNFSEATMNSLDIVERKFGEVNFKTSDEGPSMPPTLQAGAAAATTTTTMTTTEKIGKKKSSNQRIKWNKEIDDRGEGGDKIKEEEEAKEEERKTTKKEEAGIFYFDIHEEGMRTTNRSSSKFIPSIGGRFAEGQLSTIPLRPDSPMIIGTNDREDVNDIEPDENAEEANDDTKMQSAGSSMIFEDTAINEVDEIERQANAQRELIKKTLLANPIYSPEDGDDDDENDENESAKANRRARRSHHEEGEESEEETEEEEEEGVLEEDLSLFAKTWMVLDSWVTKSTFMLVENDRNGSIEHYPYRDSRSAQLATGTSEEFSQSINRILGGEGGGGDRTSNKKLHCERDMALIVRTFDFGTTMSLPKWPTKRWDFVTALILDLVCESFSFEEDYYYEKRNMEEKTSVTEKFDSKKSKM